MNQSDFYIQNFQSLLDLFITIYLSWCLVFMLLYQLQIKKLSNEPNIFQQGKDVYGGSDDNSCEKVQTFTIRESKVEY